MSTPRVGRRSPSSRRLFEARRSGSGSGFSLVDILMAVTVLGIAMAIAIPSVGGALLSARSDVGMRQVMGHLRSARDTAMSQRRTVEVQFIGTNQIRSIRLDGTTRTTMSDTFLENGIQFMLPAGVPDTPDGFGNDQAVDFGGPTTMWFMSDGSLADSAGVPLSGTVFLGIANLPFSARAVTVLGPTGRVQAYKWDSRAWR